MPPVEWPLALPQTLNQDGFSFKPGDTTIRSDMDTGPSKVRRRFTKSIDDFSVVMTMSEDQVNTFYEFHDIDLNGGINTFNFDNPITGDEEEFRFKGPYDVKPIGFETYLVSMLWERMPL